MSYDAACEELAAHFLTDEPMLVNLRQRLAQHIQDAVEDWIEDERDRLTAALAREQTQEKTGS